MDRILVKKIGLIFNDDDTILSYYVGHCRSRYKSRAGIKIQNKNNDQ